jgi:hypothetical protein
MGGAPSKQVDGSDDNCKCFFLPSKPKPDVLGTPMPPTPVSSRKRREDPVMSSVYGGLEKDVGRFSTRSLLVNGNGTRSSLPAAQVHEGAVRMATVLLVVASLLEMSHFMSLVVYCAHSQRPFQLPTHNRKGR